MKKWKMILSILIAAFTLNTAPVFAAADLSILLNDKHTGLDSIQVINEGTTFIPLKPLASNMGYTLSWEQPSKIATLVRPDREVVFTADSRTSKVNDKIFMLMKTPRIIKGTVYVPLVSAISALGGKTWLDNSSGNLYIVDDLKFAVAAAQGRTYWVSQKNGDVYLAAAQNKPKRIGNIPLSSSPYAYSLTIKTTEKGTDLLLVLDSHYSMFTDFTNGYQALVQNGTILKQMEYHFTISSYKHAPQLATTQLFMTDGHNVQYIGGDNSLGKLFDLGAITGQAEDFTVEYAADDVLLVRSVDTTQLYAINTERSQSTNLSTKLISVEDRKGWDRADGQDPYILSKMLVLTKREGNLLTFVYTPLPDGKPKKVTYTLVSN